MCHEVIPNLHVFDTEHDEKKHENKLCWWYFFQSLYFCDLRTFFNVSQLRFRPSTKKLDLALF